ncbi:MAG: hypothetical protein LUC45_03575, partial [Paraprevotella sp.]|nr:hypothetical protein [Paraprevotella sp.]
YAQAYPGATVRMRDQDKADYDVPIDRVKKMSDDGLHPFTISYSPNNRKEAVTQPKFVPTPQEKDQMKNYVGNLLADAHAGTSDAMKRIDNLTRYGGKAPAGKYGQTVTDGVQFNPLSGKMEQAYLTPTGERTTNKPLADTVSKVFKDTVADSTVDGQLQKAYRERDRLNEALKERMDEIDGKDENSGAVGFMQRWSEASHAMHTGIPQTTRQYNSDEQFKELIAAAKKNRATIQMLEDKRDNKMNSFWHTMGATMLDGNTFTNGFGELFDAGVLMEASDHIDEINRKRQEGKPLTKEEEAAAAVLDNETINRQVQEKYGGDYGAFARAGGMMANSLDMMADIAAFPGAGGVAKGIAGKVAGMGMKYLGKTAGEAMLKAVPKAIARGVLKGTGVLWEAHAAGALISNTTGLGHTMAAVGTNLAGTTVKDKEEQLHNEGGMGLIGALADAERNQIRENGSEMFGEFIPGAGKLVSKGLDKLGLSKISGALTQIGNKQWYKQYNRILQAGGFNGMPGEALEEYEGMFFDALTGHAGDAWNQMKDPKTHIDIWLGTAAMSALLGSVPVTIQGVHTAQYYRYKHSTDVSDALAADKIGKDKWSEIRDRIDQTPDEKLAEEVMLVYNAPDLNQDDKTAVLSYDRNLTKMRGYNIAQITNAPEQTEADASVNKSYTEGYNAQDDKDLQDIKNRYDLQRKRMMEVAGANESTLEKGSVDGLNEARNAAESGTKQGVERSSAIMDYLNAKQAYEGMLQRVRDDIDSRTAQSDALVDSRINKDTGMIQPATLTVDEKPV